jgi:hypothetical protein
VVPCSEGLFWKKIVIAEADRQHLIKNYSLTHACNKQIPEHHMARGFYLLCWWK